MGKWNNYLKHLTLNEPVIVISAVVGTIGLVLPLVVPPIRNALSKSEQPPPPNLKDVVSGMTGKPIDS